MNRFRTKNRAKEVIEPSRASPDSDTPTTKPVKTSKWGRKNPGPEPKQEVDLSHALPCTDDFRTSLLMNGLSARFSMLREQDDPNSKLGKASDDSVLYFKRQSRLDNFGGLTGLSDIAEVSSINGSIRPPFAFGRTDSYSTGDGYGTDDDSSHGGSIMNRSKPGEGNNLFGGRQKIYKIPLGKGGEAGAGMGGKALYESDVSQSAFQKLRDRERQQQRETEEREALLYHNPARPESPPLIGYIRNRETSSTTSSNGPSISRSSTAATSVTSQRPPSLNGSRTPNSAGPMPNGGVERSTTKTRRLYENGLDQHLHDQQSSAMSRIDTLTRQRTLGGQTPPPSLHSPASASSMSDRWDRPQIGAKASMPNLRTVSPTYGPGNGKFDFRLKTENLQETRSPFGLASPPLSPQVSDNGDQSVIQTLPKDRGKATAMGAFNRPVQAYDENKYTQRQLQLQRGRETSRKNPPGSRQPSQARTRAESNATFASGRSRSNSSAQRQYQPQDWMAQSPIPSSSVAAELPPTMGTFLNMDNSDDRRTRDRSRSRGRSPIDPARMAEALNVEKPPESDHPAVRLQLSRSETDLGLNPSRSSTGPSDSPTLGPTGGLSNIVRAHLRTDSNSSSIYGAASAGFVSHFPADTMESIPQFDYSLKGNPWDVHDWDRDVVDSEDKLHLVVPTMPPRVSEESTTPLSASSSYNHSAEQESRKSSWEKQLDAHQHSEGREETHREQNDFHHELASRRRRVQENLKSFVETESRSASPLPGVDASNDAQQAKSKPLGMLKAKTSRSSLVLKTKESPPTAKQSNQSKAMKMLGIGNATMNSSPSPSKQNFDDRQLRDQDQDKPRSLPKTEVGDEQIKSFRQARRDAQRDRERQVALRHQARNREEADKAGWTKTRVDEMRRRYEGEDGIHPRYQPRQRTPSRDRRAPPPTASSQRSGNSFESKSSGHSGSRPSSRNNRNRSGSDTSGGRSKSRNGRYRDDLAKAMAEGTGTLGQGVLEDLHSARYMPKSPANPAMEFNGSRSASPMPGNRASRSAAGAYFDAHRPPKLQVTEGDIGVSPRPSPVTPFAVNTTPSLSGSNTPTAPGFQSQGRIPDHLKKAINKHDISEPTLVSSTSRMTTINLPPGASLQNGIESAPPIPAVNPRRRQTRGMFGMSKKEEQPERPTMPVASQSTEEMSTFSDDESPKSRQKLRKSSSEGGNMNARARQIANATPSPAMPTYSNGAGATLQSGGPMENGMF